jgi:hypothetical protein
VDTNHVIGYNRFNFLRTGPDGQGYSSINGSALNPPYDQYHAVQFRVFTLFNPVDLSEAGNYTVSGGPAPGLSNTYPVGEACANTSCETQAIQSTLNQSGRANAAAVVTPIIWNPSCRTSGCSFVSNQSLVINNYKIQTNFAMNIAKMPTTWFQGGSADQTPCAVTGYQSDISNGNNSTYPTLYAGHAYHFTFTHSPNTDTFWVDPWDTVGGPNLGGTGQVVGTAANGWIRTLPDGKDLNKEHWPDGDTVTAGSTVHASGDAVQQGADGSGTTVVTVVPNQTGAWDPQFMCVYQGNVYYVGDFQQPPSGNVPGGSTPGDCIVNVFCASDLSACLNGAGLGLDPSSWVPGLVKDVGCLFQWAFIPGSINTSAFTSPFTSHVPGMWIGDALAAVSTIVGGVNTGIADGACDAPKVTPPFHNLPHTGIVKLSR